MSVTAMAETIQYLTFTLSHIVLEIGVDGQMTTIGALADSVQDVIELKSEQIEPAPRIGFCLDAKFIAGIGKRDPDFIIILDIERMFSPDDLGAAARVASETGEYREAM